MHLRRKLKWMLVSIIFPEYLIIISLSDWWLARLDTKKMHGNGYTEWTMTHAFFANMGGLILEQGRNNDKTFHPIHGKALLTLLQDGHIKLPRLTREEIQDKSKTDLLIKAAVVLQVGWILIQIGARLALGLPVSELELVTIVFILCTATVYCFWWHKPLDVRTPHLIPCYDLPKGLLDKITDSFPKNSLVGGRITNDMALRMGGILRYSGTTREERLFNTNYLFLLAGFLGVIVGGIHSLIAIVSIPSQALVLLVLIGCIVSWEKVNIKSKPIMERCMAPFVLLPMVAHIVARATLMVLVFVCFRSAPVELYHNIQWSALIPHFN